MGRSGDTSLLKQLRQSNGDRQLIMGNALPGASGLDAYVNGFLCECANYRWNSAGTTDFSPMGWRTSFDAYRGYEATTRRPRATRSKVAGGLRFSGEPQRFNTVRHRRRHCVHRFYHEHRAAGDGFYVFDLHGMMARHFGMTNIPWIPRALPFRIRPRKAIWARLFRMPRNWQMQAPSCWEKRSKEQRCPSPLSRCGARHHRRDLPGSWRGDRRIRSLVLSNPNHTATGGVSVSTTPRWSSLRPAIPTC